MTLNLSLSLPLHATVPGVSTWPEETLASLPWIKLVDDALEPDHREKSGAESCQAGQKQNAKGE